MTKEPISIDKEYTTRDGTPVRIYATDVADTYSVHAAYYAEGKWWMQNYTKHGQISVNGPDDYFDLIEKPKDTADYIEELEAELDAANNKLAKALEIAELFSGGVEYDYHGNIIGEEERKALAELEELTGGKDE